MFCKVSVYTIKSQGVPYIYVMRCAIWYHFWNLENVFFTFLKLYKWYQMAQRITYFYFCAFSEESTHSHI